MNDTSLLVFGLIAGSLLPDLPGVIEGLKGNTTPAEKQFWTLTAVAITGVLVLCILKNRRG
jgi:hypothetical protein